MEATAQRDCVLTDHEKEAEPPVIDAVAQAVDVSSWRVPVSVSAEHD